MSPRNARALSTAVVGGVAALLFFRLGLLFWVGILGWVARGDSEHTPGVVTRAMAGGAFGAFVGWLGIVISLLIPVPPEGWLWVPRLAAAVALSLYALEWGMRFDALSSRSACLLGYGAVFGATALLLANLNGLGHFVQPRLSNPLVGTIVAFIGGVLAGQAGAALQGKLTTT